jgi:hypothetical protein
LLAACIGFIFSSLLAIINNRFQEKDRLRAKEFEKLKLHRDFQIDFFRQRKNQIEEYIQEYSSSIYFLATCVISIQYIQNQKDLDGIFEEIEKPSTQDTIQYMKIYANESIIQFLNDEKLSELFDNFIDISSDISDCYVETFSTKRTLTQIQDGHMPNFEYIEDLRERYK